MRLSAIFLLVLMSGAAVATPIDVDEIRELIVDGQAETAATQLESRLDSTPGDSEARYWLARAELAQVSDSIAFGKLVKARSAKSNLERVLDKDPGHVAAREALARYLIEAPGIAGGSMRKARIHANTLMEMDKPAGYRVKAAIARDAEDYDVAVDLKREALAADTWSWDAQYDLIIEAVHYQTANAEVILDEAVRNVRSFANDPDPFLPLVDYQRGKLAAVSGVALAKGQNALKRYLQHEPQPDDPDLAWAEFRLAQVERQMDLANAAESRLQRLESRTVPEDLSFALRDERRWHYSD